MSWYQCSVPKEWILKITVCTELPNMDWDEQWWSEELSAHCGRHGSELFLAGTKIPVLKAMFEGFLSLREICGSNLLDSSKSRDLSRVFAGCLSLKSVDLSDWNTSYAESVEGVFDGCIQLDEANLSGWDLSRCKTISAMFRECNHLQTLDVSKWDVSQVQDFSDAFACCYELKTLDVSKWNTASARNMEGLFNRCSSMTELDVSAWKTDEVTNFRYMFHRCEQLKKINLKNWQIRADADCRDMFLRMFGSIVLPRQRRFRTLLPTDNWGKKQLRKDTLSRISAVELTKEKKVPAWFDSCWSVDEAESGFLFCVKQGDCLRLCSRGGSMYANENSRQLFCFADESGHSWLQRIDGLDLLNTRYVEDFSFMFSGNCSLRSLNLKDFNLCNAKNMMGMFLNCKKLNELSNDNWQIPENADTQGMYQGCDSLYAVSNDK